MLHRQRGTLNLYWVAIGSALFAGVAMAALFSMRYERNIFAEGVAKVQKMFGASPAAELVDSARTAVTGAPGKADGALRKCVIDGKAVVSNAACLESNPTSKVIKITDTKGVEAPKKPPAAESEASSNPAIDKMIEKQLR